MSNPRGKKGYDGEAPVLRYLLSRGFFRAFRLRTQGIIDKGDIGGIDDVCIEIKNQGIYNLSGWMRETAVEKENSGASTSALVVKPIRIGDTRTGEWWVVTTLSEYTDLLIRAGYGPHEQD